MEVKNVKMTSICRTYRFNRLFSTQMGDKITHDDIPKRDWRGNRVKKMKGVSPEYQTMVITHTLTKEKMLKAEMLDTLRAASKNGYAKRCLSKYMGMRGLPLKPEYSLYPHQVKCLEWLKYRESDEHYGIRGGIIALEMGLGKCTARNTPILMWDGSIKMVQDVKRGELICGDDSTPRKVLSICSGQEQMYRISPTKGDSYVVNESHILSLFISGNKGISYVKELKQYQVSWFDHEMMSFRRKTLGNDKGKAIEQVNYINSPDHLDIKLLDYLKLNITTKKRLKGYRVGVDWPKQEVPIEPYILGVWLGDGSSYSPMITNIDDEILNEISEWCDRCGYKMKQRKTDKISYGITGGFGKILEKENLLKNKHIPLKYKRNDVETRLELLAGLIDTDGSLSGGCYDIIQKRKNIAEDICFLARSVGLAAYTRQCEKSCMYKGEKKIGTYYRSTISGDIDRIPVRIFRKKAEPRKQRKSVLVTQIEVEKIKVGEYFGFTLDGNSRYLLGDFTVTHNTLISMAHALISPRPKCKEKQGDNGFPTLVVCTKTVAENWKLEKEKFFGDKVKILFFHRSHLGKAIDHITREIIVDADIVVTTYDVLTATCKKGNYHEASLERGSDSSRQAGKVIAIHCRKRWESNRPSVVGRGILYNTPWERVILDECFTGDTRIVTDKGKIPIQRIHNMKNKPKALSYNEKTGEIEYKQITFSWKKNRIQQLIQVTLGNRKVKCTPHHQWLTLRGYKMAKELIPGTPIVGSLDDYTSCVSLLLNDDQLQLVIGSYLGGGHLQSHGFGRYRLKIIHGEKQRDYCQWKANIFGCEMKEIERNGYADKKAYTFQTKEFYLPFVLSSKKTVTKEIIKQIDERALAIWYLDDGCINSQGNSIALSTESFDDISIELLIRRLAQFNIKVKRQKSKKYTVLCVNNTSVKALIQLIEPYVLNIPECMSYKIFPLGRIEQIEDSLRSLDDIFHDINHIPNDRRTKNMIVRTSKNQYKFMMCHTCQNMSWFAKRNERKTGWKCRDCTNRVKRGRLEHKDRRTKLLFHPPYEKEYIWNTSYKNYGCISVTGVEYIDSEKYKYTYDIEVKDNHNFIIGSRANNNAINGPVVSNSHKIANPSNFTYKCAMALYGRYKVCLSGTPVPNYCFVGDTRVITNKGNVPIRNLVRHKQSPSLRILSYNKDTDVFEYKKLENGWELKAKNGLVQITMGKKKITCTPNHKILTVKGYPLSSPEYVEADHLTDGMYIVHYTENGTRSCAMNILNGDQEQVVIGSYLGNGRIRVSEHYRTSLHVSHSEKQKEYSKWKAEIFQTKITERRQSAPGYTHTSVYNFDTESFYFPFEGIKDKKTTVPQELINKIDDLALLIWYLDDGRMNKTGNSIELATCSFDDDTHTRLIAKLKQLGIECRLTQVKCKGKTYPLISLNVKGTRNLIRRIYKFNIPQCMKYKIDCKPLIQEIEDRSRPLTDIFWNKHINHVPFNIDINSKVSLSNTFDKSYQIHPVTGIEVIKNPKNKTVFDIQVQDNHNFVIGSVNNSVRYGPVVSNCTDVWSQLRFCGYDDIDVETALNWKRKWEDKIKLTNPCILDMTYKDAGIKLPEIHFREEKIKLKGRGKDCYEFVVGKAKNTYVSMTQELTNMASVFAIMLRCRQCCIAPYLMTKESKRVKSGTMGRTELQKNKQEVKMLRELYKSSMGEWLHNKKGTAGMRSPKIQAIIKKIQNLDGKILIFSTFTSALDLLADSIEEYLPDVKCLQIDGDVTGPERQACFERFRKKKKIRCLLSTYKVASEGVNLTEATHVIQMEPWWNEAVSSQAFHRAWRMGQTKDVSVHNILVKDTIEQRMREICGKKDEMSKAILAGSTHKMTRMDKMNLGRLLGFFK